MLQSYSFYIMDNLEIDYKKAAQQLRSGEALFGKDGALAPLLERILNSALFHEICHNIYFASLCFQDI